MSKRKLGSNEHNGENYKENRRRLFEHCLRKDEIAKKMGELTVEKKRGYE